MSEQLPINQQVVTLNEAILRRFGFTLDAESDILDFGCGSGRHTYEFVDAGYPKICGFDVADYVELRNEKDRDRFHFLENPQEFELPFPDNSFDFVTSTSVFEHVINPDQSIREIARVLRPAGATLNAFPSRWRPVEPHFFVPFGGAIQSKWWLSLWAHLGVRNQYQRGLTARETAARNLEFCATGVRYAGSRQIESEWRSHFLSVDQVERQYIEATRGFSRVSRLAHRMLQVAPPLVRLYRSAHFRVILARNPRLCLTR